MLTFTALPNDTVQGVVTSGGHPATTSGGVASFEVVGQLYKPVTGLKLGHVGHGRGGHGRGRQRALRAGVGRQRDRHDRTVTVVAADGKQTVRTVTVGLRRRHRADPVVAV